MARSSKQAPAVAPVNRIAELNGESADDRTTATVVKGRKGKAPALGGMGAVALTIPAPNLKVVEVKITGESPFVSHRFWKKAELMAKQTQGSTAGTKRHRTARDFDGDYEQAKHLSTDGWAGIPASAFRNALISACRLVNFTMTRAKLSLFCLADGQDADTGEGLVRINGTPEKSVMAVRNETGVVDLRARPMWRQWDAVVRIRYDADQFTSQDVLNLLSRAGQQVGIGEGRPDSKRSAGLGYGTFRVEMDSDREAR